MIILPERMVVIESPYRPTQAHTVEQHRAYLAHCIADCRKRREIPYASHFGLMGDDDDELERLIGVRAGWQWGAHAELIAVYVDFGITDGMRQSIEHYEKIGKPIDRRTLDVRIVKSILEM